jgi:8-oxo-dGTP diphosphatase
MKVQKAVVKKEEKYLILRRSRKAKHFPEHWDFPGGKVKKGEAPEKGIAREIFEETGLKVEIIKKIAEYNVDVGEKERIFVLYKTRFVAGDVKLSKEHTEFKWATKAEILKLLVEPYIMLYFKNHD